MTRGPGGRPPVTVPVTGLLTGIAVLGLVAGCGPSIPDSSGLHQARGDSNVGVRLPISFLPAGPRRGEPPRTVVDGFLTAMNAYPRTLGLARAFLTPSAAAAWRPSAAVGVYERRRTTEPVNGQVGLSARVVGRLDGRGGWTTRPHGLYRHTFNLVTVGGQWRITNPPERLLVDSDYLDRYYSAESLYFLDTTRKILVPDPVFVLKGASMASDLVDALLRGPAASLDQVADPVFTSRRQVSVAVQGGTATVRLPAGARGLSSANRHLLAVQIVWTLRQVQGISAIRLTTDGRAIAVPGSPQVIPIGSFEAYDPTGLASSQNLYGLIRNRLYLIGGGRTSPIPTGLHPLHGPVDSFAVDLPGLRAAVITDRRTEIDVGSLDAQGGSSATPWLTAGVDLRSPTWDRTGKVWVIEDRGRRTRIEAVTPDRAMTVDAPGLSGLDVREIRVSHDGGRIAALIGGGPGGRLVVGEVVRGDGTARRLAIRGVHTVQHAPDPVRQATAFDWYAPTSLVVLSQAGQGKQTPLVVSIDGATVAAASTYPLPTVNQVSAGSGADAPIVTVSGDGRVYVLGSDSRWGTLADGRRVSSVRYPG
jgi:hypothetical protein